MYSSLLFLCPASGTEKSITDSFCPSWSIDYITCSVLCRMFHRSRHCFVILCVPSSPFSIHHMLLNMLINISSNIRSANIAALPRIIHIFCDCLCPGFFPHILLVMPHFRRIDCMSLFLPGMRVLWFFWFRFWLARLLLWFRFWLARLLLRFRLWLIRWFGIRFLRLFLRFCLFFFICFFWIARRERTI